MRLDGSCILTLGMSLEETVRWNKLNKQERQKLLDLLSGRLIESVKVSRTKLEEEMNVIRAILAGTTPPSNNTDTSNAAAKVVAPKLLYISSMLLTTVSATLDCSSVAAAILLFIELI